MQDRALQIKTQCTQELHQFVLKKYILMQKANLPQKVSNKEKKIPKHLRPMMHMDCIKRLNGT